jgi:AcrR family transcriptional regulator
LELYLERGYENVTVAEIAERAGLTRRTFFRYFADKREVLFAGSEELPGAVSKALLDVDAAHPPFRAVLLGLEAVGELLVEQARQARERRQVIAVSAELQERERTKLAAVTTALADALRRRGVADARARLLARVGVAIFEAAFERWVDDDGRRPFPACFDEAVAEVVAGFA